MNSRRELNQIGCFELQGTENPAQTSLNNE